MKLNLGSGNSPKPGYVNIDSSPGEGVDIVRDILRGLPYADDTIDAIYSENFLEHIPQSECIWVMNEIWRVLIPGHDAIHLVPIAGTTNYYQDPTHLSHWVPETITYFQSGHRRNLYYRGKIMPWDVLKCEPFGENGLMLVSLRKVGIGVEAEVVA